LLELKGDRYYWKVDYKKVFKVASGVLPAIEAIAATATPSAAADVLGTTTAGFCRMRSRLRQLSRCFQTGGRVPRRRRPYKQRLTAQISLRVR
jgi:hypothetical protein